MKNNYRYFTQLALINVLKKKQRTRLSVIAILLSTAIVFTSLTLFMNVVGFSKSIDYDEVGNYHYAVSQTEEIELTSRYLITKDYNTGYYGIYEGHQINLRTLDVANDILPFAIMEGELPNNENEILIHQQLNHQIGDQIEITTTSTTFQMKVVGIYQNNSLFNQITQDELYLYTTLPTIDDMVYYVKDTQIQDSSSFSRFVEKMNVSGNDVINNTEVITTDTMTVYMQDTTLILVIFIVIILISMGMSLISVHNVLLISDASRKKELGLLKSVGSKPKAIAHLLKVELSILGIVGSVLGVICGIGISYYVLNLFLDKIYVTFNINMILNPIIIIVSLLIGFLLMYISGMSAYQKYIQSTPIDDLKEMPYEYASPVQVKGNVFEGAAYRLFLMYNGRMKDQTKNIRHSFILLLMTTTLFMAVTMSNIVYKNKYTNTTYDFEITNISAIDRKPNFAFSKALFDQRNYEGIEVETLWVDRVNSRGVLTQGYMYHNEKDGLDTFYNLIRSRLELFYGFDTQNVMWTNIFHYPTFFEDWQLEILEPYIVEGSFDNLVTWELVGEELEIVPPYYYISVLTEVDSNMQGTNLCTNFRVGQSLGEYGIGDEHAARIVAISDINTMEIYLGAIVVIPNDKIEEISRKIGIPLEDYPQIMALSWERVQDWLSGNEKFTVKLKNSAMAMDFQECLDEMLIKTGAQNTYTYTNVALIQETSHFAVFIIEVLLYPLFMMLFIVSLMNMYNVFSGNVHLKRSDISIMKSVGMDFKQLRKMFIFEYFEGYINAGFIVGVMFIIIGMIETHFPISSALDIGGNIIGTLIASLIVLGPVLVLPLIYVTVGKLKTILPIENMKNIE